MHIGTLAHRIPLVAKTEVLFVQSVWRSRGHGLGQSVKKSKKVTRKGYQRKAYVGKPRNFILVRAPHHCYIPKPDSREIVDRRRRRKCNGIRIAWVRITSSSSGQLRRTNATGAGIARLSRDSSISRRPRGCRRQQFTQKHAVIINLCCQLRSFVWIPNILAWTCAWLICRRACGHFKRWSSYTRLSVLIKPVFLRIRLAWGSAKCISFDTSILSNLRAGVKNCKYIFICILGLCFHRNFQLDLCLDHASSEIIQCFSCKLIWLNQQFLVERWCQFLMLLPCRFLMTPTIMIMIIILITVTDTVDV